MARKSLLLRIDPVLHEALQRWAEEELRSLNGQIEYLLREAVLRSGRKLGKQEKQERPGSGSEEK
ncbi:MAG: toxin-antitoxin system HicB family antitoxin [Gemmataceae bacterium]|nr:toxin-antitoxin system HicB family antitoxin [Gemmataceae bacterium]